MKTFVLALFMVLLGQVAMADTTESLCHGKYVDPITDICWDCLFPMTIGDSTVADSDVPDTDNPSNPVCECGDFPNIRVGLAMGYWEPMALVDVTRYPFAWSTWAVRYWISATVMARVPLKPQTLTKTPVFIMCIGTSIPSFIG